jgi:hypothetical protein
MRVIFILKACRTIFEGQALKILVFNCGGWAIIIFVYLLCSGVLQLHQLLLAASKSCGSTLEELDPVLRLYRLTLRDIDGLVQIFHLHVLRHRVVAGSTLRRRRRIKEVLRVVPADVLLLFRGRGEGGLEVVLVAGREVREVGCWTLHWCGESCFQGLQGGGLGGGHDARLLGIHGESLASGGGVMLLLRSAAFLFMSQRWGGQSACNTREGGAWSCCLESRSALEESRSALNELLMNIS